MNTGVFDPLHNLDELILDGNQEIVLSDHTFGKDGLKRLTVLSLDYCNLATLPDKLFDNLP